MTFKSLPLLDLLPAIPAKSQCMLLTPLCGWLTLAQAAVAEAVLPPRKGSALLSVLVDSIVMRSLL